MNTLHKGLTTILRSAVTGEALPLPEGFTLEEGDELIQSQSLVPLIFQGACNCKIPADSEIMGRYQTGYLRTVIHSEQQDRAVNRIFQVFEENGIDYMPLKGCNLKKLYPRPELRIMGDADILIRLEQYEKIEPLIAQLQYEKVSETAHEFCWKSKVLFLELHKRIIDPNHEDLCGYFGDGWDKAILDEGHRYMLSREDEFIFLFTHMTKHFRLTGIGARLFVDLYLYRRAYPQMDEAKIEAAMKQLGILDFYRNVMKMLEVWFEDRQPDAVTDMITEYIFSSGNWGSQENKVYAKELKKEENIKNSRFRSLMRTLFIPLEEIQSSYNILYKFPILLPVFWVVRWFDVLLHRRGNIKKRMDIVNSVTDEKLRQRQEAFRAMGLDF